MTRKNAARPDMLDAALQAVLPKLYPTGEHRRLPDGYCPDCQGQCLREWLETEPHSADCSGIGYTIAGPCCGPYLDSGARRNGMRVLVACEFSGIVRDAFRAAGHDAMSCDILATERPGPHYRGDVRDVLDDGWDLMVAHPPCTYLALSGVRWLYGGKGTTRDPERWALMEEAAAFFRLLLDAPIPRVAVENPTMHRHAGIRPPDQWLQPWQYGHGETKRTGLWLRGLPPLTPTNIVPEREQRVHLMPPGPDRWRERSRTYPGIALAMADQWGEAAGQLDLGIVA